MKLCLSIRERGMITLVDALSKIRRDDGYNTTVMSVQRRNSLVWRADQTEIHLQQGRSSLVEEKSRGAHNLIYEMVELNCIFFNTARLGQQDEAFNAMWADIQKVLDPSPNPLMFDRWYPRRDCREFQARTIGAMPRISDHEEAEVVGAGGIEIEYAYIRGNPYKWDEDDEVIEIDYGDV